MKLTVKAFKQNWLEMGAVLFVLILAGIIAIFKPFGTETIGIFSDVATAGLIGVAVLLVIIGRRRSVV